MGWGRITARKESRHIAQVCRDGVRKAKAQMELRLAKCVKGNKKRLTSVLVVKGRPRKP